MMLETAAVFAISFLLSLALFAAGGIRWQSFLFFGLFSLISLFSYVASSRAAASVFFSLAVSGAVYFAAMRPGKKAKQERIVRKGIIAKKLSDDFCAVWIGGRLYGAFVPEGDRYREDSVVKAVITGKAECDIIRRDSP